MATASPSASTVPPHYFPTPALDHAFAGIMAGAVATICMNPLDLIKVQFQVNTSSARKVQGQRAAHLLRKFSGADVVRDMYNALGNIVRRDGYRGLYRGLSPNVVGNSASWGLYFLFYTMLKEYMAGQYSFQQSDPQRAVATTSALTPGQHLLAASESGAITALLTNPIWVVKTRMFTTSKTGEPLFKPPSATPSPASTASPPAQAQRTPRQEPIRGLLHGVRQIWKHEGIRGLYRGGGLALVGVSNGAVQFMTYEELKRWRMGVARRKQNASLGAGARPIGPDEAVKLPNAEYVAMSGVSKVAAIALTYPYQVVRSRIQNHATAHIYPTIPACIRLTWRHEGFRGFYKGMAANLVRIVPGTCVTFVVYENCSWALRGLAERRRDSRQAETQSDG